MSDQVLIFVAIVVVLEIVAFAGLAVAVQVTEVAPRLPLTKKSRRRRTPIAVALVLFGVAALFGALIVATQGSSIAPLAGQRFPSALFWSDL